MVDSWEPTEVPMSVELASQMLMLHFILYFSFVREKNQLISTLIPLSLASDKAIPVSVLESMIAKKEGYR